MKINKIVISALRECKTKEDIDFIFETEKINSYRKRCDILRGTLCK